MNIGTFNTIDEHAKIHPSVIIGNYCMIEDGVEIGEGTVIKNYVELRKNTIIGKNCYIDSRVSTSGGCTIGDCVTLRYGVIIARDVIVEDYAFLAPRVMTEYSDSDGNKKGGTVIGSNAHIGTHTVISQARIIAPGTRVGSCSLVKKDMKETGVYYADGVVATLKKEIVSKDSKDRPLGWACQECGRMLCHRNAMCPVAVFCDSCHNKRQKN